MENIIIRLESAKDRRAVEELTRKAFRNVYKPGADEHYFVRETYRCTLSEETTIE